MTHPAHLTLRTRLRSETAEVHARLDSTMSRLDMADAADYGSFLEIHLSALQSIMPRLVESGYEFSHLPALIERDLEILGRPSSPASMASFGPLPGDPLGYAYVLAGSQMGAKILNRRRLLTSNEKVVRADAFLHDTIASGIWNMVKIRLEDFSAAGPQQDDIIDGALACFRCYGAAAKTGLLIND